MTLANAEATAPAQRRVDVGRLAVVFLFAMTAALNVAGIPTQLERSGWQLAAGLVEQGLALAFCALVVWAYLRRGPAAATDRAVLVCVVAPLATILPLLLAAVPARAGGPWRTACALCLTLGGLAFSVWSLRALATNLSIVPQARQVVATGPYRFLRHPLYLGEIVAFAGLALRVGRWPAAVAVVVAIGLQAYRATREEALLLKEIPGYAAYAERTHRVVPGLW